MKVLSALLSKAKTPELQNSTKNITNAKIK